MIGGPSVRVAQFCIIALLLTGMLKVLSGAGQTEVEKQGLPPLVARSRTIPAPSTRSSVETCSPAVATFTFGSNVSTADQNAVRTALTRAACYAELVGWTSPTPVEVFALTEQTALVQKTMEIVGWNQSTATSYWANNPWGFSGSVGGRPHVISNAASASWAQSIDSAFPHEYFHIVQNRLVSPFQLITGANNQTPNGGPRWLIEGAADLASDKVRDYYGLATYDVTRQLRLSRAASSSTPLQNLESWTGMESADGGTAASYSIGFAAADLLVHSTTLQSLGNFWRGIGNGLTWQQAFSSAFGRSVETFYQEFALYRATLTSANIEGRVISASGAPFAGIHVYACPIPAGTCGYAVTGSDGGYRVAVATGSFRVQFGRTSVGQSPDGYFSSGGFTTTMAQATLLTVANASITGVNVTLPFALPAFVVNNSNDGVDATPGDGVCATALGTCTLRAAIQETNALSGADVITLSAGTYTLSIAGRGEQIAATGDLDITDSLTINGAGASTTIIDAGALDRVFDFRAASRQYVVSGVTLRNGNTASTSPSAGGCITLGGGDLTLTDSAVTGCTAPSTAGGGIWIDPSTSATILRSTISGNSSPQGGGINSQGTVTIANSTISGNGTTTGTGTAIFAHVAGTMTLRNVTIASNLGFLAVRVASPAQVNARNVIIANGTTTDNCSGPITNLGNNLEYPGTLCGFTQANPLLAALANNGGPTQTHALNVGSAAIDAGDAATCAASPVSNVDQRGLVRPVGTRCDIGAVEASTLPGLTLQPADTTVSVGQGAQFEVGAVGSGLSYQWQISTNGGTSWSAIANTTPYSGATTAILSVAGVPGRSNGTRFRAVVTNTAGSTTSNSATLTVVGPMSTSVSSLRFSASGGAITAAQSVSVTFDGKSFAWTAASNQSWLQLTNATGTAAGVFAAQIVMASVPAGSATQAATITLSATGAPNSPLTIPVTLALNSTTQPPFGQVDTPIQGATGVQGAIGVTGWALDDVGVTSVKIYRSCVSSDAAGACVSIGGVNAVFVGDAAFVPGARSDVETAFPSYPQNYRGGWGYLMLTNMLPNVPRGLGYGGQGPLSIYAFATDAEGNRRLLGRAYAGPGSSDPTTITMSNETIAKPFGAIDTPAQGQLVSGSLANFGWALTPDSNTSADASDIVVPTNGSTMAVVIDGAAAGTVSYNQCRGNVGNPVSAGVYCNDDVANIFGNPTPQSTFTARTSNPTLFRNLDAGRSAIGSFDIDTTQLTNGRHSIAWGVTDSSGRAEGIGSREFIVLNGGSSVAVTATEIDETVPNLGDATEIAGRAVAESPVWGRVGFNFNTALEVIAPDPSGMRHVAIPELDRLELWLGSAITGGYLKANNVLRPLPAGSLLDTTTGLFTWAPIAGYLGVYELVFLRGESQLPIHVNVVPKIHQTDGLMRGHIDLPQDATTSGSFSVAGWAIDLAAWNGSGVGAVHVWARRTDQSTALAQFLGAAEVGLERPDVSRAFGDSALHAGWSLNPDHPLVPGVYELTAYFWSNRTGRFEDASTISVTVR